MEHFKTGKLLELSQIDNSQMCTFADITSCIAVRNLDIHNK